MKLASHSILSNATATREYRFPYFTFLSKEEENIPRIDGLTGLSPKLMHLIQGSNELAYCPEMLRFSLAHDYLARLAQLEQICLDEDEQPGSVAPKRIKQTAESYRLATILYIHHRIVGYASTHLFLRAQLKFSIAPRPTMKR